MGGRNELHAALREVNTDSVKNFLVTQDCDLIEFKMNVPSASHMGGMWERLIRTVRSVLSGLLEDHAQQLDDESLRTLFTEAENIVNSRPLTIDNLSDPDAPKPITPNHLLTLESKVVLPPPGNFSRTRSLLETKMAKNSIPVRPVLAPLATRILLAHSINVKNGMMSVLTAKSVILSLFATSPALGTSGHLPK